MHTNTPRSSQCRISLVILLTIALSCFPNIVRAAQPTETLLAPFKGELSGGFSHRWVAYIVNDEAKKTVTVELNGEVLGPFSNLSRLFQFSSDGNHIAFAANQQGKWYIYLDGKQMWKHDGLGWGSYSWIGDLDGRQFVMQTSAAVMKFSPTGDSLAYMAEVGDKEYGIAVNGKLDTLHYPSLGLRYEFVGDDVIYAGFLKDKTIEYIYNGKVFGPYDSASVPIVSADHQHFLLRVTKGQTSSLIVDGAVVAEIKNKFADYQMAANGQVAYSYQDGKRWKVNFAGNDLQGDYDYVTHLTLSSDGSHVAFWARNGNTWTLKTDEKDLPSFGGPYVFEIGSESYSIVWDAQSENIAYLSTENGKLIVALNGKKVNTTLDLRESISGSGQATVWEPRNPDGPGISFGNGRPLDRDGYMACLSQIEALACNPVLSVFVKDDLVQMNKTSAVVTTSKAKEGPFKAISSDLIISSDRQHYAYAVKTDKGQQVVVDGTLIDLVYESIYRAAFASNEEFAFLGKREGNLYRVAVSTAH
ncbi:MAG: PD40 domain-containing protein [Anaerolineae bacterium]|nr:PD40 domain-containing protein [Anaerolineae bacterium]